jgi:hypothetical protein
VVAATRAKGTSGVPEVAAIMACASAGPIGPCSMSMRMKSSPDLASSCTVWTEGMVAIAPNAHLPSCHKIRSRFNEALAWSIERSLPRPGRA